MLALLDAPLGNIATFPVGTRRVERVVVRYDPLLAAVFEEHGVPVVREARVGPPFRHAYAPHGHDDGEEHDHD